MARHRSPSRPPTPGRFDRAVARLRRHPVVAVATVVASVVLALSATADAARNLWRQTVSGPDAALRARSAGNRQRARDSLTFLGMAPGDTTAFFAQVHAGKTELVRLFLVAGFSPNTPPPAGADA